MSELYDIRRTAIDDLQEWIEENPGNDEPHDTISEIADSSVPVYTGDLIQLALDNLDFAVLEPELGPAFDGKPTPVNIIAANVYEYIEAALWEYYEEHKDDYTEDEES